MNRFGYLLLFVAGTVTGAALIWNYSMKRAEAIVNEEIQSVKNVFSQKAEVKDEETRIIDISYYDETVNKTAGSM